MNLNKNLESSHKNIIEKNTKELFLDMISRYVEIERFYEIDIYIEYVRHNSRLDSMFVHAS